MSSTARAIASMRASVERQPVEEGRREPVARASARSRALAARISRRALAQDARRGGQRPGLLFRRGVGDDAGGGAGLGADLAHGGADVGFGGQDGGHGMTQG